MASSGSQGHRDAFSQGHAARERRVRERLEEHVEMSYNESRHSPNEYILRARGVRGGDGGRGGEGGEGGGYASQGSAIAQV